MRAQLETPCVRESRLISDVHDVRSSPNPTTFVFPFTFTTFNIAKLFEQIMASVHVRRILTAILHSC
jgi:hypothetical protein